MPTGCKPDLSVFLLESHFKCEEDSKQDHLDIDVMRLSLIWQHRDGVTTHKKEIIEPLRDNEILKIGRRDKSLKDYNKQRVFLKLFNWKEITEQ